MRGFALVVLAMLPLIACGDDGPKSNGTVGDALSDGDVGEADATDATDATAEEGLVADGEVADAGDAADLGDGEISDVDAGPTIVRNFVQELTGLSQDYVFKGVWVDDEGHVVTVGNDGVIASYADGKWKVVSAEGDADLLNDVHGSGKYDLWAVGKDGVTLKGAVNGFGAHQGCTAHADCDNGDPCTQGVCDAQVCKQKPTYAPGCCGLPVATYRFDSGNMDGWTVTNSSGGLQWTVASIPNRYTSAPAALYFGDPAKVPPDFDTGQIVRSTAVSPSIQLPPQGSATLRFQIYMDTESGTSFDVLTVEVQGAAATTEIWDKNQLDSVPTNGFVKAEADLSVYKGQSIKLRFNFDSVDSAVNDGEGVYLDDITVDTECDESTSTTLLPTLWAVHAVSPYDVYAVGLGGVIAHYDGNSWRQVSGGAATGNNWNGIWGAGGTVSLVGDSGKIAESKGGGLVDASSPTTLKLRDVHTAEGFTYWGVGDGGTVVKGQNGTWELEPTPVTVDLYGVFAHETEVYAVGDAGTLLYNDGSGFVTVDVPTILDLRAVTVSPDGTVTLTGEDGILVQGHPVAGFSTIGVLDNGGELAAAWSDADTIVLVGENSSIFRYDGAWNTDDAPADVHLRDVWGTGASDIWAVGLLGTTYHFDGTEWTEFDTPVTTALEGVWGRGGAEVYAVGANGTVMQWDGTEWRVTTSSTTENLRAVYALGPANVWAVGANGTIMHNGGFGWGQVGIEPIKYSDGTEEDVVNQLFGVWGAAPDDIWAVGDEGQVLHWDGELWTSQNLEYGITLRGIYGLAADDVWAVGNEGHVIHWDGESWTPWYTGSIATLYDIWGDGVSNVVIVGDIGTVLRLESHELVEDE